MSAPTIDWSDERVEVLRAWWAEGKSSGQIATELKLTRGAVIGKLNRLGLIGMKRPQKQRPPRPDRPTPRKKREETLKMAEPEAPDSTAEVEFLPFVPPQPVKSEDKTIVDLGSRDCRWPLGAPMDPPLYFCGEPTLLGKPYCGRHCAAAFTISTSNGSRAGHFKLPKGKAA